jgi:hypothetical protein
MLVDEESGGVSLEEEEPQAAASSKQLAAEEPTKPAHATAPTQLNAQPNTERRFVLVEDVESSYNLGTTPLPMDRPRSSATLPATDLNRGDLAEHHFTPILALSKYPYKFCNKSHLQDIASAFFDAGKFWDREWDL